MQPLHNDNYHYSDDCGRCLFELLRHKRIYIVYILRLSTNMHYIRLLIFWARTRSYSSESQRSLDATRSAASFAASTGGYLIATSAPIWNLFLAP
jgi:hypothetical protein